MIPPLEIKDIIIFVGAFLGSFKSQTLSSVDSSAIKALNVMIGLYAGTAVAFHYLGSTGYWVSAIIALIASSLTVALMDALFKMAPSIAERLVEKYLGIEDDVSYDEYQRFEEIEAQDDIDYDSIRRINFYDERE